ncbi:MAG: oligosaccharide flippase family protein [Desulforhopalus sp.]
MFKTINKKNLSVKLSIYKNNLALKKIFTASSQSAINKIIGIVFDFILSIVLARLLGVDEYGFYTYAVTVVTATATLSTFGYDTASLRFIPEYQVSGKWNFFKGYVYTSLINTFVISFFASCIFIVLGTFYFNINNSITYLLVISAPLIPLISLSRVRQYVLRSLKHVIISEILDIVGKPFLIVSSLFIYRMLFNTFHEAQTAIIINLIISIFVTISGFFILYIKLPRQETFCTPKYAQGQWLKVSIPIFLVSAMQLITGYSDTLMLGLLANYTEAGVYSVAVRITSFVGFSLMAINMILAPIISELFYSGKGKELQQILTGTVRVASVVALIISAFLIIFGKPIIWIYGDSFSDAYTPLLILVPGQLLNVFCGSVGLIVSLTGNQNFTAIIMAFSAIINIILNYILIPHFGMIGAAVSTSVSIGIWNISMLVFIIKRIKIQPAVFTFKNGNQT